MSWLKSKIPARLGPVLLFESVAEVLLGHYH